MSTLLLLFVFFSRIMTVKFGCYLILLSMIYGYVYKSNLKIKYFQALRYRNFIII